MPASSAMRASFRLSGQLPLQRSGTVVTARPDEQLAPNSPILSLFALYIVKRSGEVESAMEMSPEILEQEVGTLRPLLAHSAISEDQRAGRALSHKHDLHRR